MQRRRFHEQLCRQAAALALGSLFAAPAWQQRARTAVQRVDGGGDPFTLGVASGMPRPDSLVLWTRLAPRPLEPLGGAGPAPVRVRWELADDAAFSQVRRRGERLTAAEHAHSVHVEVTGLPSATGFFYRFISDGVASPVGRTRTAPAADADVARLRLALASCQHYEQGAFTAQRDIAEHDVDAVLFVGDYIYESTNPRYRLRAHEGPDPIDLDAYRARHAHYKLDAELQAAHAAHPWIVTWDDHEVENDYANDLSPKMGDPAAFLRRRAAAFKAYFEHMPVAPGMAPRGAVMAIHDRYHWGRLADLWTLDNRQYRSVQACATEGRAGGRALTRCDTLADPARTMFGAAQERWLADGLAGSTRPWKLLAQGTQMSESAVDTPLGRNLYTDGWDGYPAARTRLLDNLGPPPAGGVICMGGDVHRHVAANLRVRPGDDASPVVASEFVCSSVTTRGLSEVLTQLMRASNPDIAHARSDERGWALIDVQRGAVTCEFRATPHPAKAGAALRTQARFTVEAGRPGVQAGG